MSRSARTVGLLAGLLLGASGCLFVVNEDPGAGGAGTGGGPSTGVTSVGGGGGAGGAGTGGGGTTCAPLAAITPSDISVLAKVGFAPNRITRRPNGAGQLAVAGVSSAAAVSSAAPGDPELLSGTAGLAWFDSQHVIAGDGSVLSAANVDGGVVLVNTEEVPGDVRDVASFADAEGEGMPFYFRTDTAVYAWTGNGQIVAQGSASGRHLLALGPHGADALGWLAYDAGNMVTALPLGEAADAWSVSLGFSPEDFVVHLGTQTAIAFTEEGALVVARFGAGEPQPVYSGVTVFSIASRGDRLAFGYRRNDTPGQNYFAVCCLDASFGGSSADDPADECAIGTLSWTPEHMAFFEDDLLLLVGTDGGGTNSEMALVTLSAQ